MTASTWLYTARLLVMSLGAFTIGFAMYVATLYIRGRLHTAAYRHARHVLAISTSYCLLALTLVIALGQRTLHHDPLNWRLPLAGTAFVLGAWALYQLIKVRAREPHNRRKEDRT